MASLHADSQPRHEGASPGEPADDMVLRAERVSKVFGKGSRSLRALDNLDITIPAKAITGLIGPDGAGKTTFMRLACGIMKPTTGSIRVFGQDPVHIHKRQDKRVSYMPQRFGLYEDLTVMENLSLYADLQGVPQGQRSERFEHLLNMSRMKPFVDRLAGKLSGGMKQKLGLMCTLVRMPDLLILDEPTVGVDPVSRLELWGMIAQAMQERSMAVLLSTAYLDEAQRCAHIVVLDRGSVLGTGSPDSFLQRVEHRVGRVVVADSSRRLEQQQWSRRAGVIDALVQGNHLRIVADSQASFDALVDQFPELHPCEPRFEDAYIDLFRSQGQTQAGSEKVDVDMSQLKQSAARTSSASTIIEVHNACKKFGSFTAVDDLNFTVNTGEIFGLLGANGAGKTTTFRMLCGLLAPTSGTLRTAGVDMRTARAAARANIGYMSQGFALYRELSVMQNLRFFAGAYGLFGKKRDDRVAWAIEEYDLGDYLKRLTNDLPLGYKQRLAMACALMHQPKVLFLDEPTSGVDPIARRAFWTRINTLAASGVAVLVTTHFMEEAEFCDRLVIIVSGHIMAQGSPAEIRSLARTPHTPEPTMTDAFLHIVGAAPGRGGET